MRGGRNKFGPMYKRDRARKLQILRQRQLALQAIRGSISGGAGSNSGGPLSEGAQSQLSPTNYPPYTNMHIKQEIQIPQVRFLQISFNNNLLILSLAGLITYIVSRFISKSTARANYYKSQPCSIVGKCTQQQWLINVHIRKHQYKYAE